jgi:D-alanyl-D-alanine carboxypeptidase
MDPFKLTFGVVSAFVLTAASLAQTLDERVASWQADHGVLGVAVAISDGHETLIAQSGLRMVDGAALEPGDRFLTASVSKTFTAAAVLALAEQGELSLESSAASVSGMAISPDITIGDLLIHSAGLPEYIGGSLSFDVFLAEHGAGRLSWSSEEVRAFALAEGQSGSDFAYSNAHYVVLGAVIEGATGMPLDQALEQLVFGPSGLDSAALVRTATDDPDALGYSAMLAGALGGPQLDARLSRELATLGGPAGGAVISAEDLAIWAHQWFGRDAVFAAPAGGSAFGLEAARIQIAPGVYRVTYGDAVLNLHGGDGLGVTALAAYNPATNRSIAILVNDDAVRSLGFGQPGYLDALALELLSD